MRSRLLFLKERWPRKKIREVVEQRISKDAFRANEIAQAIDSINSINRTRSNDLDEILARGNLRIALVKKFANADFTKGELIGLFDHCVLGEKARKKFAASNPLTIELQEIYARATHHEIRKWAQSELHRRSITFP